MLRRSEQATPMPHTIHRLTKHVFFSFSQQILAYDYYNRIVPSGHAQVLLKPATRLFRFCKKAVRPFRTAA